MTSQGKVKKKLIIAVTPCICSEKFNVAEICLAAMKANSVRPMLPFFPFQNFPFLPAMPDNLPHHPPPHHLLPQSPPFGYHNANSKLTSGSPSPSSPPYGFHHSNPKLTSGSPPPSSPPYAYQGGKIASGSPTHSSPPYGYQGGKIASGSPTPSSPPFGYRGSKVASGSPTRSSPPSSPPYSDGPEELEHNRDTSRHTGMLSKIPCYTTILHRHPSRLYGTAVNS
jgi:hypothetical protein